MLKYPAFILFFFFFIAEGVAQDGKVSGQVKGSDGLPLPGVQVRVKGTKEGVMTDKEGKYKLEKVSAGATLTFSFVGYKTVDKSVGTASELNAVMEEEAIAIKEVVVLGYGETSKARLVNSAVQLDAQNFSQTPYVSAEQALQGKVAGLVMSTPSGTPGAGMMVRIRGFSSVSVGSEPLYVIDGVPVQSSNVQSSWTTSTLNPLSGIDNENIESITVLKDATSTALYGARGSGGVVVIKTKRGRRDTTEFNMSTSYGFNNDAVPGPKMLTGAQREELFYESLYNSFGEENKFTGEQAKQYYEKNLSKFGDSYFKWNQAGRPETNWSDVIRRKNARVRQTHVSASGGSGTFRYYTSLGHTKQAGTIIGSDFERIGGQLNLDANLSKKLTFSTQNSASYTTQNGIVEQKDYDLNPRASMFLLSPLNPPYLADGSINLETGARPNPLYITAHDVHLSKFTRIMSNNSLTYDLPVKNLKFTTRMAFDWMLYNYKGYMNIKYGGGASQNGSGSAVYTGNLNYVIQNYFDYEWEVAGHHNFSFKVMQEFQRNNFSDLQAGAYAYAREGMSNLANAGTPVLASASYANWLMASYLGMMEYSGFQDRWVVNATIRREGSSRFPSQHRWGTFWSAGLAWNLHKEKFMKSIRPISIFKLRASYGKTGNSNIYLNQYQSLVNYTDVYDKKGVATPSTRGNENLTWETSFPFEAGADFGLFDNRIFGRFTYFYKETKDLLQAVPLSGTSGLTGPSGFASQFQNTGALSNQGFEVELSGEVIRKEDFNMTVGGNVATNRNKILRLGKTPSGKTLAIQSGLMRTDVGHPVIAWYMPSWAGVDPEKGTDTWYVDESKTKTTEDYSKATAMWQGGSGIPMITAGLNFHLDYKGFFLDAAGYFAGGNKIYEEYNKHTLAIDQNSLLTGNAQAAILDRWQKPGDRTRFPKLQYDARPDQSSSKFLYDATYFRLKDVTIGYNFNAEKLKKTGIHALRFFVRAGNFFTWVKDSRLTYDPDINVAGSINFNTPPYKSFITGINLKF